VALRFALDTKAVDRLLNSLGENEIAAVVINDALAPFGITHIDMPMTPSRIWSAIQNSTVKIGAA